MQVPSTVQGLRNVLRSLGYTDVLTGLDLSDPGAKDHCREQIQWAFDQSAQTSQDAARCKKALSYIDRFPWPSQETDNMYGLNAEYGPILRAVDELRALLEEEQILRPVEVTNIEEDEDGEAQTITITTEELVDAALTMDLPFLPEIPLPELQKLLKKFKPKPRETISYLNKTINVIPWVNLSKPGAWDDATKTAIVNTQDFSWYGPYSSPASATRSAWHIATKGDNQKRRVPMDRLKLVRWADWTPAHASFPHLSKMHRMTARKASAAVQREEASKESLDAYMKEFWAKTEGNFLDPKSRIYSDMWLELRPFAGAIHLSFMLTMEQGQGNAHKAMKFMTDLADKHGVPMDLLAKATGNLKGKMTTAQLKRFYARYGFQIERGNNMYRPPRGGVKDPVNTGLWG